MTESSACVRIPPLTLDRATTFKMATNEKLIRLPTREEIENITHETIPPWQKSLDERISRQTFSPEPVTLYTYDRHSVISPKTENVGRQLPPWTEERRKRQRVENTPRLPVGVVFLTSVRDIGRFDRNGLEIRGIIETTNDAINGKFQEAETLGDYIRIRGVITDDLSTENLDPYPTDPRIGKPWIFPTKAKNDRGELLTSITERIPSNFRAVPREAKDEIRELHLEFEEKIFKISQQMGADIVISDHLMVRLIHLIKENKYSIGRVLNIHPAISDTTNPSRLPGSTPTRDAIDRARFGAVYDKKTGLFLPMNEDSHRFKTGASLHIMNKQFDGGPVIADAESTLVSVNDTPQRLRERNYPTKRAVFVLGIIHYVRTMLRDIDKINFDTGTRTETTARID